MYLFYISAKFLLLRCHSSNHTQIHLKHIMGLGSVLSYLPCYNRIFGKSEVRVLILGLHGGVGKTTVHLKLIYGLSIEINTVHTVGFNVDKVDFNNLTIEFVDAGGGDKIIPLWKHFFPGAKGVIFVIDSTLWDWLDDVVREFTRLLNEKELENLPFLVLANKQDQSNSMSLEELKTALNLDAWKNRSILLQAAVATEGTGLKEGMEWLCAEIQKII